MKSVRAQNLYGLFRKNNKGDANAKRLPDQQKIKTVEGGVLGRASYAPRSHSFGKIQQISEMVGLFLGIADPNRGGNLPTTERKPVGNTWRRWKGY